MFNVIVNGLLNTKMDIKKDITNNELWDLLELDKKLVIYSIDNDRVKNIYYEYLKNNDSEYILFTKDMEHKLIKSIVNNDMEYYTINGLKMDYNKNIIDITDLLKHNHKTISLYELYNNYNNYMDCVIYYKGISYHLIDKKDNKLIISNYKGNELIISKELENKKSYEYILYD